MPCRVPNVSTPLQCNKKVARGTHAADGVDHAWPEEGHLIIERCEFYCWYCWETKGKTRKWKFPWYLRRHVQSIHCGRTHPYLTCSEGWKVSQTGNRKPWQETGSTPPMGKKTMANTPKASGTVKPPKTPERKQRRQTQKMKRASAVSAPTTNLPPASTTPSPPALTYESSFDTPGSQLPLPSDFNPTPASYAILRGYNLDNNNGMALMSDNNSVMTVSQYPATAFSHSFGSDMFDYYEDTNALGMSFCPSLDNSLAGLDYANSVPSKMSSFTTNAPTSFDSKLQNPAWTQSEYFPTGFATPNNTTPGSAILERTWTQEQVCRTDGTVINPVAPLDGADSAADDLYEGLNHVVFDRVAMGELTEGQALYVLQSYTESFKRGER